MKRYVKVGDAKSLIGKYFEVRDSHFFDRFAKITYAFFAAPDEKTLVIRCCPDRLIMEYWLEPNTEGKYNLERVYDYSSDIVTQIYIGIT